MKSVKSRITRGLQRESILPTCDNSGAKLIRVIGFRLNKGVKGRRPEGGVGSLIIASVRKGTPEMRKKVVFAVIARQKKEFRRPNGVRVKFEDNAAIVLKDNKGNPKGTIIKGPIAKEVAIRWPTVAKQAKIIL